MDERDNKAPNESRGKEVPNVDEFIDSKCIKNWNVFNRDDVKKLITEYSDIKCQTLLERIKELEVLYEGLKKLLFQALGENKQLQEAADKLAEALQHSYSTEQEWAIKRQEILSNYNKLKGK